MGVLGDEGLEGSFEEAVHLILWLSHVLPVYPRRARMGIQLWWH